MLGTSTRTSDVLINLGLNPLRRLREVGSPQFGVLSARAPPSPRCTALTAASCENHGAAPNYGTRVPGIFGGKPVVVQKLGVRLYFCRPIAFPARDSDGKNAARREGVRRLQIVQDSVRWLQAG